MPAKGKYKAEIVDLICGAIAETGSDSVGYDTGGISHDTFYKWMSAKPEFAERVAQAKRDYRRSRPKEMRALAVQRMADYLHQEAVEIWEHAEEHFDKDGNVTGSSRGVRRIKKPTPQWVIDRILGKSMPVLEAVQVLLNEGVATPEQAAVVEKHINAMQEELRGLASLNARRIELEAIAAKTDSNTDGTEEPE